MHCIALHCHLWVKRLTEWTLAKLPRSITHYFDLGLCAARRGHTRIVRRLIEVGYLRIFSKVNLARLLQSSRDGGLVQMYLERIFHWAAKYKQVALLQSMFALAKQQRESVVDYQKCVYLVMTTASKYSHLNLLKWCSSTSRYTRS